MNLRLIPATAGVSIVLFVLTCSSLFLPALFLHQGSKLYYVVFTASYFFLLASALKNMKSYSYLFLAVFLWLGFWLKYTAHMVFHYTYKEAIGSFVPTSDSMDEVLLIAVVACWGVVFAHYCVSRMGLKSTVYADLLERIKVPSLYQKYRTCILVSLIALICSLTVFNLYSGVFQIGLAVRTILIWPLNALISWLLSIGLALIVTTVLWWEVQTEQRATGFFVAALTEPLFASISILSRALYIFHFIPVFLSFMLNKTRLKLKLKNTSLSVVLILSAACFLVSLQTVSVLRNYYYSGVPIVQEESGSALIKMVKSLIIDRWLGVEGVMAVASYPNKSLDLLKQGLFEQSVADKIGMYQYIAQSHYLKQDTKRFIFGTIPGPAGFFYYSGTLYCVFLGLFFLTTLMMLSEVLIAVLTNNIFLISLFAMDAANAVAQFGVTPRTMIKHYLFIFAYALLLRAVQSANRFSGRIITEVAEPQS